MSERSSTSAGFDGRRRMGSAERGGGSQGSGWAGAEAGKSAKTKNKMRRPAVRDQRTAVMQMATRSVASARAANWNAVKGIDGSAMVSGAGFQSGVWAISKGAV